MPLSSRNDHIRLLVPAQSTAAGRANRLLHGMKLDVTDGYAGTDNDRIRKIFPRLASSTTISLKPLNLKANEVKVFNLAYGKKRQSTWDR
jgi:hypothetical protein